MKELQAVLMKISSLRNGKGGDVFFRGLAQTFQADPIIPPTHSVVAELSPVKVTEDEPSGISYLSPDAKAIIPERYIVKTKLA